jgi:hypothetical protein
VAFKVAVPVYEAKLLLTLLQETVDFNINVQKIFMGETEH